MFKGLYTTKSEIVWLSGLIRANNSMIKVFNELKQSNERDEAIGLTLERNSELRDRINEIRKRGVK